MAVRNEIAQKAFEALSVLKEVRDKGEVLPNYSDLAKEVKEWNALMLTGGLLNMLLFKFSKAKIEKTKKEEDSSKQICKPNKEWVIAYFVSRILERFGEKDGICWESVKFDADEIKQLLEKPKEEQKGKKEECNKGRLLDDDASLLKKLVDVEIGLIVMQQIQTFLTHLSRLLDAVSEPTERSGSGEA